MTEETANSQDSSEKTEMKLTDATASSIQALFNHFSAKALKESEEYDQSLETISDLIKRAQSIGSVSISMEVATMNSLRNMGLVRGDSLYPPYCLISIEEAKFLVCAQPNGVIQMFLENINKPFAEIRNINEDKFWYESSDNKPDKTKPKFFMFDLNKDEDQIDFLEAIVKAAAACSVLPKHRNYNVEKTSTFYDVKR